MRSNLLSGVIKTAVPVVAGIGLAVVADKFAPDKVPGYSPTGLTLEPKRVAVMVAVFVLAAIAVKFIARKLNISILK